MTLDLSKIPLDQLMYGISLGAVAMMAAAGVLEAGRKRFDLFGMVVVALAAALGGGSLRDVLLDRPVFWVADQTYLVAALIAAMLTFFLARIFALPARLFLVPDAAGLALFTISGTKAALVWGAPWLVASFMGVITGVMGGVLRDVLCNEEPLVFQGTLYATAAWAGALVFIGSMTWGLDPGQAAMAGGALIFLLRVAAIRWEIALPRFTARL
ncbi:trimeric intracellular cation channel family protein [Allochromatium humboldtianum]|uniref:Trimeric intracellular cation channel family protein n=1 Tax=Allochromatium humboldtianum TaxID=504901 RepID=A0A850R1D7_9GAMM|nr:trimeric intracellular cation channel family protein [Allochromatium humboldtianum]NVZ08429.1 trimeric intracellular cation channel family protein [Allochromatium humboldtianum]